MEQIDLPWGTNIGTEAKIAHALAIELLPFADTNEAASKVSSFVSLSLSKAF
ncbi:MAG: hypothetical protein KIT62_01535 [Cyclobacteriaceae bacterium]|nr:hypothetical protein [Cyclobacteriaceae bacterium]